MKMIVKKSKNKKAKKELKYSAAVSSGQTMLSHVDGINQQESSSSQAPSRLSDGNNNSNSNINVQSSSTILYNNEDADNQAAQENDYDNENDEENIVIDMVDEDDDDDDDNDDNYDDGQEEIYHRHHRISSNGQDQELPNYFNNNNNNDDAEFELRYATKEQALAAEAKFVAGDLIWFDPNQLGYSIPGKVLDFYPDLNVLTIEGCGQPVSLEDSQLDEQVRNRLLVKADEQLQLYELSDLKLINTIRFRQPISDELGIGDLVELSGELSNESIVWNLKLRFKHDLIYTKCGHKILISLNPFKQLCDLYELDQVNKYDTLDANKLVKLSALTQAVAASNDINSLDYTSSKLIRWLLLQQDQRQADQMKRSSRRSTTPALQQTGQRSSNDPLPAHIFNLANEALKQLLISCQDQCFVLLGDSGSGKTEAAKLLCQYYATVNKSTTNLITEQMLESIQVLESFGNAKTVLNHNSSRFGKLIELRFNLQTGLIHDAKTIELNLLDRTRIVCQNEQERNYNVFYELLSGLSQLEKEKYGLQSAEKYFYLNQGQCIELAHKDDAEDFRSLLSSMQVLGFNYEEQDTIFRILATILHLGNIYFHRKVLAVRSGGKFATSASGDSDNLNAGASAAAGVEGVEIGSDTEVRWVSHLLQVQFELVMRCLTVRTIETSSMILDQHQHQHQQGQVPAAATSSCDTIVTPLNIDQALDTRDAIARSLYTCLFKWLVQRINVMISASNKSASTSEQQQATNDNDNVGRHRSPPPQHHGAGEPIYLCRTSESLCEFQPDKLTTTTSRRHQHARKSAARDQQQQQQRQLATLSILDAFGFENLAENNFEQLCINYAAELLHYHTNRYLVRLEQAEYARERISWQWPIVSGQSATSGDPNYGLVGQPATRPQSMMSELNQPYSSFNSSTARSATDSSQVNQQQQQQKQAMAIVNLISKKPLGILALLDDECNFPKATDQSFAEKCHHNHALNENYQCARLAANCQEFGVRHFRQSSRMVWYQVDGFIEKNRDSLRPDVMELLLGSNMTIVADMLRKLHRPFGSDQASGSSYSSSSNKTLSRTYDGRYVSMKPRAATVAAKFQDTLHNNRVLEALNYGTGSAGAPLSTSAHASLSSLYVAPSESNYSATGSASTAIATRALPPANVWFIVCLKPNRSKWPAIFDVAYVQEQVKAMNLLELAQMRQLGYPVRLRYNEFLKRYKCLVAREFLQQQLGSSSCVVVDGGGVHEDAANKSPSSRRRGSTKAQKQVALASMRHVCSSIIEHALDTSCSSGDSSAVSRLQPISGREPFQCGLTKMFLNERVLHALEQRRLNAHLSAIVCIQSAWKMWLVRRDYLAQRRAAIVIQSSWRGQLARRNFRRQFVLIVLLQRRWRRVLATNRRRKLEAKRRALKQQQQLQLQEIQAQHCKLANQLRFRLNPKQQQQQQQQLNANPSHYYASSSGASTVSSATNGVTGANSLLDVPEDLAQLYRLQRNWLPQHDLSQLNRVNVSELLDREQARRATFGRVTDALSVPFVAAGACDDTGELSVTSGLDRKQLELTRQVAQMIDRLELDERYSLANFLTHYYTRDVPQFGYSRLPITRPFSWPHLVRLKRAALKRARKQDQQQQVLLAPSRTSQLIERRFVALEQKAVAIYKLLLRYIDSDQSLELPANQVGGEQLPEALDRQQQQPGVALQRLLKFKLISDYVNYLCLTEPLLRNEVFLQLASLKWQNPKVKSAANAWKLMLNCLACFEPLDSRLAKLLLKYASDHCTCTKYKQLVCEQLFLAHQRSQSNRRMLLGKRHCKLLDQVKQSQAIQVNALGRQRRFPTTILEYWAHETGLAKLAVSASCYMDEYALNSADQLESLAAAAVSEQKQLNSSTGKLRATIPSNDLNSIINYSNKTLVRVDSHSTAERVAKTILEARGVSAANLTGWSVEVQHEGALSEFSSRLRGDDHLMDHFARLELLPELVQLIDDELEALDCEQLDELGVGQPDSCELLDEDSQLAHHLDQEAVPGDETQHPVLCNDDDCHTGAELEQDLLPECCRSPQPAALIYNSHDEPRHQRRLAHDGEQYRLSLGSERRSWDYNTSGQFNFDSNGVRAATRQNGRLRRNSSTYQHLSNHGQYPNWAVTSGATASELDLHVGDGPAHFRYRYERDSQYNCDDDYQQQQFFENGRPVAAAANYRQLLPRNARSSNINRRSMSMQELRLAASSALNGRYFAGQLAQSGDQQLDSGAPPLPTSGMAAHYDPSYSSSPRGDPMGPISCCRPGSSSSGISGNSRLRRHSGSMRHVDHYEELRQQQQQQLMMQHQQQHQSAMSGTRRRSATPNSLMTSVSGNHYAQASPLRASRHQQVSSASSSVYGYATASTTSTSHTGAAKQAGPPSRWLASGRGNLVAQQQQQQQLDFSQQRFSRSHERADYNGRLGAATASGGNPMASQQQQDPRRRRSASSSSRPPTVGSHSAMPPTSDYASTHSDYEQIACRSTQKQQQQQQRHLNGNNQVGGNLQQQQNRNLHRLLMQDQQQQVAAAMGKSQATHQPPQADDQHDSSAVHYAATSSAMSDTSEAPSLASHVKAVKVPQVNGDLDRYLDDLFNPLLDGADLDEMSDARSLATSIRGCDSQPEVVARPSDCNFSNELGLDVITRLAEEQLGNLFDAKHLSKIVRGLEQSEHDDDDDNDKAVAEDEPLQLEPELVASQQEQLSESAGDQQRPEQPLSPTFESLIWSLKQQASGLSGDERPLSTTAQLVRKSTNLGELNMAELKALNEKLENEIQAARSARPSLGLVTSESLTASVPPPPPPPPPQPSFISSAVVGSGQHQASPPDDIYSRAKTIRIGKWRWPPAADETTNQSAQFAQDKATSGESDEREQVLRLPTGNERKRASLLSSSGSGEPAFESLFDGPEVTSSKEDNSDPGQSLHERQVNATSAGGQSDPKQTSEAIKGQAALPVGSKSKRPEEVNVGAATGSSPAAALAVGRLKISSEMKAKLEQLTNSSGSTTPGSTIRIADSSSAAQASSASARAMPNFNSTGENGSTDESTAPKRLADTRKHLLEHQLLGSLSGSSGGSSGFVGPEQQRGVPGVNSKVLAVKQQLAAAAGVALSALDSGTSATSSQASSRRQSSQLQQSTYTGRLSQVGGTGSDAAEIRRLVLENDELGPQSRAAINQRHAFYLANDAASGSSASVTANNIGASNSSAGLISDRPTAAAEATGATGGHQLENRSSTASALAKQKLTNKLSVYGIGKQTEAGPEEGDGSSKRQSGDAWTSSPVEPDLIQQERATTKNKINNSRSNYGESHKRQKLIAKRDDSNKEQQRGRLTDRKLDKAGVQADKIECLTYANVDWQVRVRKELFMPSESYDDELIVQLIFAQLVADVFNPRHWTRLNNKERAAIKSMMKDNSIGYSPSLPPIGRMQPIKRELVRMARSFGLYFTRSYQALNFACLTESCPEMLATSCERNGHSTSPTSTRNSCEDDSQEDDDNSSSSSSSTNGSQEPAVSWTDSDNDDYESDNEWDKAKKATSRHLTPSQTIRLAQKLRSKGELGSEWIDMVAVHHSGLRLVALVCDTNTADNRRQSLASDRLSIRNSKQFIANQIGGSGGGGGAQTDFGAAGCGPPTQPPIGYKVLETLKFRDMTGVTLVNERVLRVSMTRAGGGKKSWLLSSSQANQLASLLKSLHLDYEANVRPAGNNNKVSTTTTSTGCNHQDYQSTTAKNSSASGNDNSDRISDQKRRANKTNKPPPPPAAARSASEFDPKLQEQQRQQCTSKGKRDALLAPDDDHDGDHLAQRQAANSVGKLCPPSVANNVLADRKRVLSDDLASTGAPPAAANGPGLTSRGPGELFGSGRSGSSCQDDQQLGGGGQRRRHKPRGAQHEHGGDELNSSWSASKRGGSGGSSGQLEQLETAGNGNQRHSSSGSSGAGGGRGDSKSPPPPTTTAAASEKVTSHQQYQSATGANANGANSTLKAKRGQLATTDQSIGTNKKKNTDNSSTSTSFEGGRPPISGAGGGSDYSSSARKSEQHQSESKRRPSWQNSLSRMSNKFSLFGGGGSTVSSLARSKKGNKKQANNSGGRSESTLAGQTNVADDQSAATSDQQQRQQRDQQVSLDAWIETKVDFDDDDEDDSVHDEHYGSSADGRDPSQGEAASGCQNGRRPSIANSEDHQQQLLNKQRGYVEEAADRLAAASSRQQQLVSNASDGHSSVSSATGASAKDDGKYSMLQYALYNFREAIDKYSLESRANLRAGAQSTGRPQSHQHLAQGDCSTLRGSLKLIESLRNGATPTAGDSSQLGAATAASNSGGQQQLEKNKRVSSTSEAATSSSGADWTWRELAEMVKFTRTPIKRSLVKLDLVEPSIAHSDHPDSGGGQAGTSGATPASQLELDRRAIDCFAATMRYMGDLPAASDPTSKHSKQQAAGSGGANKSSGNNNIPDSEVECVYLILINCHNYPRLRDEVYCQLIKQTTNNRSDKPDSCLRGWRLMSLIAAYFDCSATLRPYLLNYLEQNAYDKRRAYHSAAMLCLQNLRKTFKYKGRKNVPSIEEIVALSAGRISKRQIYRLPGGTERVINTKSTTVVDDIIREICASMLMVSDDNEMLEFSLYCIADGDLYTMPLNRDEYILDITTELIKNHQQYFLIFCRSIWHYPLRLDSKLYIEVTFNQIAPDYLEGLLLVLPSTVGSHGSSASSTASGGGGGGGVDSRQARSHRHSSTSPTAGLSPVPLQLPVKLVKELARLAALLHRASGTDYMPHKDEIKYLLPKPIVQAIRQNQRALAKRQHHQPAEVAPGQRQVYFPTTTSSSSSSSAEQQHQHQAADSVITPTQQYLIKLVQDYWHETATFDTLDAKAQFLDIVRLWPLFGSSFFAIKLIQRDLIQPQDYILALNKFGVQMLDMHSHETHHKYSFNEVISTRKVRSEDGALYLDMKCGNLMKRTIIRIQTDQAHEISRLIRQYIDIELSQANNNNNNNGAIKRLANQQQQQQESQVMPSLSRADD